LAGLLVGAPLLAPARRRRFDPVWVRAPSGVRLANQAMLAGVAVASAGLLAALVLYILLANVSGARAIDIATTALTICAPALVFVVTLSAVAGMLLGELFAAAVLTALVALTAFALPQSVLFPWTVLGGGTYHDRSIGFGPDAAIVVARALQYLGIAAGLALAGTWLLARIDRRSAAGVAATALLGVGIVIAVSPSAAFGARANTLANIPSWPIVAKGSVVRTRGVTVRLDCSAGRLVGSSALEVVDAAGTLWLGLNPGLRVNGVEPKRLAWRQDDSGAIALDGVRAGDVVHIDYEGSLVFHRDDYQPTRAGVVPARVVALPIGGFLSRAVCFLTRGGDWYPRAIGPAEGSDGVRIGRLRFQVDQALTMVEPATSEHEGEITDPSPCALVAIGADAQVDTPLRPTSDEQVQWTRLRTHLHALGVASDAEPIWLPLLSGTSAGLNAVCIPAHGLPTTLGPFANRLMENLAAQIALRGRLVMETRPAVRAEHSSTQESSARAFPALLPAYLEVLTDAIADTLEPDLADLVALRQEALTSDTAEGQLLMRGVLPGKPTYLAVLGIHRYRAISGDTALQKLTAALAAASADAVPSPQILASVVQTFPAEQREALAPLLAIH